MQRNELIAFIKKNANAIYLFINEEILKDIGIMNPNYFVKLVDNVFIENIQSVLEEKDLEFELIPYYLLTHMFGTGHIAYTSLRVESIDFAPINKEARAYYNYARFFIDNDKLVIQLMQSKIGGMPIDADIVKYTKEVILNKNGVASYKNISNDTIQKGIDNLF